MVINSQHRKGEKLLRQLFSEDFSKAACERLAELVEEHKAEPKALRKHTHAVIYPMIAAVQLKQEAGLEKAEAIAEVSEKYYKNFVFPAKHKLERLLRLPFAYKLFIPLARLAMKSLYGPQAGFENSYRKVGPKEFSYDVLRCPYYEACKNYDLVDLVDTFCTTDDLVYGDLHRNIEFQRSSTLGRSADFCDFNFREGKEEVE